MSSEEKCYTFKVSLKYNFELFRQWQRIMLDEDGLKEFWEWVTLTSEYKWPPIKKESDSGCWCK